MKSVCLLLTTLLLTGQAVAQIKTINYDIVSNEINGSTPIPSEDVFFIKGVLPKGIDLVQVGVKKGGRERNFEEIYSWKRPFDFEITQFELFVSNPLRSNENYFFEFSFFQKANATQIEEVQKAINSNLESYLRANLEVTSKGIKVNHSNQVIISQMDQIVTDALEDYRHRLGRDFRGFSEIFRQKLEQKDRLKLRKAKFNIIGKNKGDNDKAVYANQYINELIALAQNESNQFVDKNLLTLVEIRRIESYPTEKKPTTLPLNFGYATIPFKRSLPQTEYLNGMYAGVSLPLGNRAFAKFMGNSSFSAGVFLQNFETQRGDKITGQYIGIPIYAGLGYRLLKFMRFNAGAVMLNQEEINTGLKSNHIQFFTGLSIEFNLWMGLNNRR